MSSEEKPRKSKVSPKVWQYYRVEGASVTRLKKECPRCGKGVFLAEHSDRLSCGKCGYTTYRK